MKQLFPFLLCLTLCAGCLQKDYQYAVVCNFPAEYGEPSWLVVTDDDGNILKTFEVPELTSQFTEKFNLDKDQVLDTYNLHLVKKGPVLSLYSYVLSCYGVENGGAVTFKPSQYYTPSFANSYLQLLIKGISAPDTLEIPGCYYKILQYDAATQTASIFAIFPISTDCIVRIRTQASGPFRSLHLPTSTVVMDTLRVEWTDFLPESDFKTIELPGNDQVSLLEINAIEPDLKQSTTLMLYDSSTHPLATIPDRVSIPAGLHPQSLFRMRLQQGSYTAEKIFQPDEVLRLDNSDLTITSAVLSKHIMEVQTSGNPDLIETTIRVPYQSGFFQYWEIQAPPELCKSLVLPDLTDFIPGWLTSTSETVQLRVTAYGYDQLDYAQLLAGFPYKGGDGRVFPIARAGLQKVTKEY